MQLGYARVSTKDEQTTALQLKALKEAGVEKVFEEEASGGRWERPELHELLKQLREGDVVVVWKLDRLSRSLKDLLHILDKIKTSGAGFRSLTENIETTSPAGRMMVQMLGAFAEFEREMIRERTKAGLQAAREEGRVGGRRPKLTQQQRTTAIEMVQSGKKSAAQVARLFGVHRSTISRLISGHREGLPLPPPKTLGKGSQHNLPRLESRKPKTPKAQNKKSPQGPSSKNPASAPLQKTPEVVMIPLRRKPIKKTPELENQTTTKPKSREEERLIKKFWEVSNWFVFFEYSGSFATPAYWTMDGDIQITKLREFNRSLGVIEGTILSYDSEKGKGRFQIDEEQFPFCFHQKQRVPHDLNEFIGLKHRYTFRPLIEGIPEKKQAPSQGLSELRLAHPRYAPTPQNNYVEIMGLIYRLHPDGFWAITWDFYKRIICHVPFSTPYPYPDEIGAFAWLKGEFEPKTGQISLLETEAIEFLEGEERKKAVAFWQKRKE